MNKIFAPFLPPWAETGLQPAFYDVESGTVLQQTARMYNKVNQLTRLFNEFSESVTNEVNSFEQNVNDNIEKFEHDVNETVADYIEKFTALKDFVEDYFDNLDVQEEINNKLDAMAEAGTLADIISAYLNSIAIFGYDSVADMKSSTNLIDGSYARTMGYYAKNDGGGAVYKIRNITNDDVVDDATIIALNDSDNNLIAELIIDSNVNVNQFGAYGDGTHDDATAIQKAFNSNKIKTLSFIGECTYLINSAVTLTNKILLKGNKAVIKAGSSSAKIVIAGSGIESYQAAEYLWFDGDFKASIGIEVSGCRSFRASQIYVRNVCDKGIYVHADQLTGYGSIRLNDFSIENVIDTNDQYLACQDSIGIDLSNTDCEIYNGNIKEFKKAIKCAASTVLVGVHAWNYQDGFVEDSIMVDAYGGARISNCYCDGLPIFVKQNTTTQYSNIVIDNCIYNFAISQQVTAHPYVIYKGNDDHVNITNCSIDCSYSDGVTSTWPVSNTFENVYQNNNFCTRAYFQNFYVGTLSNENIGTLYYERIGDVVEYVFDASGTASTDASYVDKLPMWARPKNNIRMTLNATSGVYPKFTITNIGEVQGITCSAWAHGSTSAVARYNMQSPTI